MCWKTCHCLPEKFFGNACFHRRDEFSHAIVQIGAILVILQLLDIFNVFLYSTGEPKYNKGSMFAIIENSQNTEAMFWIFLFGFFWVIALFIAVQQFTIAAATARASHK